MTSNEKKQNKGENKKMKQNKPQKTEEKKKITFSKTAPSNSAIVTEERPGVVLPESKPGEIAKEYLELDYSRWKPEDDLQLIDFRLAGASFSHIKENAKFSSKFSLIQIAGRWSFLLYDEKASQNLGTSIENSQWLNKRVLWGEEEERILRQERVIGSTFNFLQMLERHRPEFHYSRTPKSLEAHYYRMKRNGTLDKELPDQKQRKEQDATEQGILGSKHLNKEDFSTVEKAVLVDGLNTIILY